VALSGPRMVDAISAIVLSRKSSQRRLLNLNRSHRFSVGRNQ
jgi:hypothetical protein